MNTVTRVATAQSYSVVRPKGLSLSFAGLGVMALVMGIFFSAFGVIYMKDVNRRLYIQYQGLQQVRQQYEVEWGKQLLQEGAWSTQSRIQRIAKQDLGMVTPKASAIQIVEI